MVSPQRVIFHAFLRKTKPETTYCKRFLERPAEDDEPSLFVSVKSCDVPLLGVDPALELIDLRY